MRVQPHPFAQGVVFPAALAEEALLSQLTGRALVLSPRGLLSRCLCSSVRAPAFGPAPRGLARCGFVQSFELRGCESSSFLFQHCLHIHGWPLRVHTDSRVEFLLLPTAALGFG